MGEQPVVVTGIGSVAPGSRGAMRWWARLLAGESAVGPLTEGAAAGRGRLGAAVELIDKRSLGISRKELRYLDAVSTYCLVAAKEAVADAGLDGGGAERGIDPDEVGFAIGMFSGPLSLSRHETDVNLFAAAVSAYYGSIIGNVTIPLGICGPSLTHLNLDLAGSDAIGYAYEVVRHGKARAMLAGGADSGFNPYVLAQLEQSGLLANGAGAGAGGLILGEGAALLVLESLESAERRGRRIYAEVLGYHKAEEDSAHGALAAALAAAGVEPRRIDCIMASATGAAEVDRRESDAVTAVFGEPALQPPATSITWSVGHTLGAAGALQAVASVLALCHQRMPAAGPLAGARWAERLNPVRTPGGGPVGLVLQNGFGLRGQASFLVLGRHGGGGGGG